MKPPNSHSNSRRRVLKSGLAAAAVSAFCSPAAEAQESTWPEKKPGELRVSVICGTDDRIRSGLKPVIDKLPNSVFWWANNYRPITPEMIYETDLLITYYSGYLYDEANTEAIIDNVTNRGMGWICLHNTPWFTGEKLNELIGANAILHREIQPVVISHLNQDHPVTKGMEPFIINLEEQFGLFLKNPDDPDITVLLRGQGVHDKRWTIQGLAAQRGKGRVLTFTPGHYEWAFYNEACQEILWRSAQWVLTRSIEPFYGSYDNFIW